MNRIVHFLHVDAPASEVYRALATSAGLSRWWTSSVDGKAEAGGTIHFQFLEGFHPEMDVTAADPNEGVAWTCTGGNEIWEGSRLRFELRPNAEATAVLFTHTYAQSLDEEAFGEFNYNWAYYLRSLKQYCETGTGTPFDPEAR